jgi:ABC-2 type transport system permease protein
VSYLLTFVLPLAFAAYLPAAILLQRTSDLFVPLWLGFAAPAVGVVLYIAAVAFFRQQMRSYSSPGH